MTRLPDCACLDVRILGPKRNLDLDRYVNEFLQIISFLERGSFKLRWETVIGMYSVVLIKHVAFLTIWVKLTVAFTYTSLPLNPYPSVFGCGCSFGFEQKFWKIDGFGEKNHGSADFAYP